MYYGHALNIRESLHGDFHIETVCTLFNMGQVASYQNKYVTLNVCDYVFSVLYSIEQMIMVISIFVEDLISHVYSGKKLSKACYRFVNHDPC